MYDFAYHDFVRVTCTKEYNCPLDYGETYFVDVGRLCKIDNILYAPVYERSRNNKHLPKAEPLYYLFSVNGVFDIDFSSYSYEPWDIV